MNIIKKYIIMALVAMTSISFAAEPVEHEQQEATQGQLGNGLFFDALPTLQQIAALI